MLNALPFIGHGDEGVLEGPFVRVAHVEHQEHVAG